MADPDAAPPERRPDGPPALRASDAEREVGERRARPGAPTFRIRLISVMGGTDVKRGR